MKKRKTTVSQNIKKATTLEWQMSLFGAFAFAIGLGALLANIFMQYILWLTLIGGAIHAWGMYKIHQRNK